MRRIIVVSIGLMLSVGIWPNPSIAQRSSDGTTYVDTVTGCKSYANASNQVPPKYSLIRWSGRCYDGLFQGGGIVLLEITSASGGVRIAFLAIYERGMRVRLDEYYQRNNTDYVRLEPEPVKQLSPDQLPKWARFVTGSTGSGVAADHWVGVRDATPGYTHVTPQAQAEIQRFQAEAQARAAASARATDCSSYPNNPKSTWPDENMAAGVFCAVIRKKIEPAEFTIAHFKKTDGQRTNVDGVQGYRLLYEAEIVFPKGVRPECGGNNAPTDCWFFFSSGGRWIKAGQRTRYTGAVSFQQFESGWKSTAVSGIE